MNPHPFSGTAPQVEVGGPVGRLALVLRPEREMRATLEVVRAWAANRNVSLAGLADDPRLPTDCDRRSAATLAVDCDAVLALGGDGTMLAALRLGAPHGTPALGVNLGSLGYLAEVDLAHLPAALDALGGGEFTIEPRAALTFTPQAGAGVQPCSAYNDIVLSRVAGRGQAALGLRIDGDLLVRYSSDGVIVATPMGSTAYSFAAGGPLVSPRAHGMIVTPDAPHGLFNRAVVLADGECLGIEVLRSSAPLSLELDGRLHGRVEPGARIDVRAHPGAVGVIRIQTGGFAERARRKLGISDPAVLADFDLAGHER